MESSARICIAYDRLRKKDNKTEIRTTSPLANNVVCYAIHTPMGMFCIEGQKETNRNRGTERQREMETQRQRERTETETKGDRETQRQRMNTQRHRQRQ